MVIQLLEIEGGRYYALIICYIYACLLQREVPAVIGKDDKLVHFGRNTKLIPNLLTRQGINEAWNYDQTHVFCAINQIPFIKIPFIKGKRVIAKEHFYRTSLESYVEEPEYEPVTKSFTQCKTLDNYLLVGDKTPADLDLLCTWVGENSGVKYYLVESNDPNYIMNLDTYHVIPDDPYVRMAMIMASIYDVKVNLAKEKVFDFTCVKSNKNVRIDVTSVPSNKLMTHFAKDLTNRFVVDRPPPLYKTRIAVRKTVELKQIVTNVKPVNPTVEVIQLKEKEEDASASLLSSIKAIVT
jgi:hypothetical protein